MTALATDMTVLYSLAARPSRSSAAAIGHQYVLNNCPPQVQIKGLSALSRMICDWSVAILEEFITDPLRNYLARQYAVRLAGHVLGKAVQRGYSEIDQKAVQELVGMGIRALQPNERGDGENPAAEILCSHLSQAIEKGCFGLVPDF